MKLLTTLTLLAYAIPALAWGQSFLDVHHLIVNRHSHEGDYTHRLQTVVGGVTFDLPMKRQVFVRASLAQCKKSAQAQLDAMEGYLIESWRCEKVGQ